MSDEYKLNKVVNVTILFRAAKETKEAKMNSHKISVDGYLEHLKKKIPEKLGDEYAVFYLAKALGIKDLPFPLVFQILEGNKK